MTDQTRIEAEAAAFRRLLAHLRAHPEAQNIDLMILADFCRNCLSKWYRAELEARGETHRLTTRELGLLRALLDREGQALDFLFLPSDMGRPIAAPPDIPEPQKNILRDAFARVVKDPQFLAEADRRGLAVESPMTGDEVDRTVARI